MQGKTLKVVLLVNFILWLIELDISNLSLLNCMSIVLWLVIAILSIAISRRVGD